MKRQSVLVSGIVVLLIITPSVFAGSIIGWGVHSDLFDNVPAGNDFVDISSASGHALALKSDGTVVAWGYNTGGQCDVPDASFIAVSAGLAYSCGIKINTLSGWVWMEGSTGFGYSLDEWERDGSYILKSHL